jgi:hypothetical protein
MKFILALSLVFGSIAFAAAETEHQDGPCKKLMDACKTSPFAQGENKQKMGIYKECFLPLVNGQSVSGVAVDKADVEACRAKRAAHQMKKGK